MLSQFRTLAKSPVAVGLIGLLVVSFAIWGIHDVFQGQTSHAVVKAGSRQVTPAAFKQMFETRKSRFEQQTGQRVSMEEIAKSGAHLRFVDELATREGVMAFLAKVGVVPSKDLIIKQIRDIPAFFDPVTGKFSKEQYTSALAQQGLTEAMFEQELRDGIAASHFEAGMYAGLRVPRIYGALLADYTMTSRDLSFFDVTPASVAKVAPPTDAQLQQFMKELESQLKRPEMRQITLVRFSPGDVAANVKIDEADLRKRYEFKRDSLSQPERRSFVHVPAKDAAAAQKIVAALRAGQDPAAVAKANGVQPVVYQDKPKSAVLDRRVAAAAFGMQAGQVSDPVQGDLGLAVVQLSSVTPGRQVSFEEVRPQLVEEARKEAATAAVYEQVEKYEQARDSGASLVDAANKAGAKLVTLPPIARSGATADGRRLNAPPILMKTAFDDLSEGAESDSVAEAGNGEYFAVKVDKVFPAALPKLDEIRQPLTLQWMQRETIKRMQAKADELAARVRKGETLEAVAKSVGASVRSAEHVGRNAGRDGSISGELVGKAFNEAKGAVFTARDNKPGFLVARVDAVNPPVGLMAAQMAEGVRPQASSQVIQESIALAAAGARKEMKVKTDPALAARALGVEPPAADEGKAKAKK